MESESEYRPLAFPRRELMEQTMRKSEEAKTLFPGRRSSESGSGTRYIFPVS